jgi:hypothetical protein
MSLIHLNQGTARGFGTGGAVMLPRVFRRIRAVLRKIHAAIAAARLHRLRDELISRDGRVDADPERQPRMPLMLGDKWDF